MAKARGEIKTEDTWNVEHLYPSLEDWNAYYQAFIQSEPFKKLDAYRGFLHKNSKSFFECIELFMKLDRSLSKFYTYAHLKHDEDVGNESAKQAYGLIRFLYSEFRQAASWIEPEILQIPDDTVTSFLKDPLLEPYVIYLKRVLRLKPHTLSANEEKLMSLAAKAMQAPAQIFLAYNNADIVFDFIEDSEGKKHELSHGSYQVYMHSKDRILRKSAFESMHKQYQLHENALAEMLQGQIQGNLFRAKARHYTTCIQAALFPQEIDPSVYFSLIKAVNHRKDVLHSYIALRKKIFNLDLIHGYDMSVSCAAHVETKIDFNEAVEILLKSVAVLGEQYCSVLEKGIKEQRWVDRYENTRKRSGAYSSGCYDSYPYILLNYQGTLSDVMTLAHEAGHSMHTYLSHKAQPYQYADYTIFVAEVASTVNEELVFRFLLNAAKTKEEKLFLINTKIDGIRATFFRQALFAEFELKIHTLAEEGAPLTPQTFKEIYKELNHKYYGDAFCSDDLIQYECFRIPHFYSQFYVYQYATGISAAYFLVEKILKEKDASSYLKFLSLGCSQNPIELLKVAGVDMSSAESIEMLIERFKELTAELEKYCFQ
ncbi:MAG: oligoendopeptidase F [Chlamydiota bacterium]